MEGHVIVYLEVTYHSFFSLDYSPLLRTHELMHYYQFLLTHLVYTFNFANLALLYTRNTALICYVQKRLEYVLNHQKIYNASIYVKKTTLARRQQDAPILLPGSSL
jgi:hypothetical protein